MSEDLTKKLPMSDSETLDLILTTTQNLGSRFDHLETRLQILENKVEERLYDTRPIWHKVLADIAELQAGQKRLEESQQAQRLLIIELSSMVCEVNRDQIVMNDVIRRIQLDFHNFDERLPGYLLNHKQQNSST